MSKKHLVYTYENLLHESISDWGRVVYITYKTQSSCSSCTYDPISKESTNIACSTCGGKYFYNTETVITVNGVMKTFLGDLSFRDFAMQKFGYIPDHDGRLTCWLSDVLLDSSSVTGVSYLDVDKNVRVKSDNKTYKVVNTYRTGIDTLKVIVASLKQIQG